MFQLVDVPLALPGSCYLCGSGDKPPYIDWGVSIEFHGALYTCSECTGAVASLLGFVPRHTHNEVIKTLANLNAENAGLVRQNLALREAVENLVVANESVVSSDDLSSTSVADAEPILLASDKTDAEESRSSTEFLDSGTRASDESSDDERVDELHSDESSSNIFKLTI